MSVLSMYFVTLLIIIAWRCPLKSDRLPWKCATIYPYNWRPLRNKSIDMLRQSHDINNTDYTTPYGGHKVVVRVYIIYLMSCVHKIAYCVLRCYSVFQGSENNLNTDEGNHPANNPLLDIIGGCCGARWSVYTDCSGVNVMLHGRHNIFFYFLRGHSNFKDDFRLEDDGINMENNTSTWSS